MEFNNVIPVAFLKRAAFFQCVLVGMVGSMKASRDLQVYNLN